MAGQYSFKLTATFNAAFVAGIDVASVSINPIFPVAPAPNMISVPIAGHYVTDVASPTSGDFRFVESVTDVTGGVGYALSQIFANLTVPATRRTYYGSMTAQLTLSNPANPLTVTAVIPNVHSVTQQEEVYLAYATILPVQGGASYIVNVYIAN